MLLAVTVNACALLVIYEAKRPPPLLCTPMQLSLQQAGAVSGELGARLIQDSEWQDLVEVHVPCVEGKGGVNGPPISIPDNQTIRIKAVYIGPSQ